MKPISGWENVQALQERQPLPLGAYIVKIMGAAISEVESRDGRKFPVLDISYDIAEGDFTGYYAAEYRAQTGDKRWKGVLRQFLPREDGSDQDKWTKSKLKAIIEAIEKSNSGYRWDWNESGLKGRIVGCIYRNEEWEWNGNTGFTARPFKFAEASKVREGNFKLPKEKLLKRDAASPSPSLNVNYEPIDEDDDLPF